MENEQDTRYDRNERRCEDGYKVSIDEQVFILPKPDPTGRELLELVHRNAADFLLAFVIAGEPDRLVEPDESIDLSAPGTEQLYLISKARHYSFHIDEKVFTLTNRRPTGRDLLALVGKHPCSHFVVQVLPYQDDEIIDPAETVDLAAPEVERFVIVVRDTVTVVVDGNNVDLPRGNAAVSEIKRRGNVAAGYVLVQDLNGRLIPLDDDKFVEIHGCETFISHVKEGGSS